MSERVPLAKSIPIPALNGSLGKFLIVPPGRTGVAVLPDGSARVYPPGRHLMVSFLSRLRGKKAGLRAGYYADQVYTPAIVARGLLSGDDQLVDAGIAVQAQVADAGRFLTQVVDPPGELWSPSFELSSQAIQDALAPLARQYAAEDLVGGMPAARLQAEILPALQTALASSGLRLVGMQGFWFMRSEDRLFAAEKAREIEARLQQLELERQLSQVEAAAQLEEFTRQVKAESEGKLELHPTPKGQAAPEALPAGELEAAPQPASTLRTWVAALSNPNPRHWVWQLLARGEENKKAPQTRLTPGWWRRQAFWLAFLLVVGIATTILVSNLQLDIHPNITWGFILGVWGLIIPLMINEVRKLIDRRDQEIELALSKRGALQVLEWVKVDRPRADRLVREQCQQELSRMAEGLRETRSRVYNYGKGNPDLAVQIHLLEDKVKEFQQQIALPSFAAPVYLGNYHLDDNAWEAALGHDEDLILFARALNELSGEVYEKGVDGTLTPTDVAALEKRLRLFIDRFAARSRVSLVS